MIEGHLIKLKHITIPIPGTPLGTTSQNTFKISFYRQWKRRFSLIDVLKKNIVTPAELVYNEIDSNLVSRRER